MTKKNIGQYGIPPVIINALNYIYDSEYALDVNELFVY